MSHADFLDLPLSDTWEALGPSTCGLRPDVIRQLDTRKRTAEQRAVAGLDAQDRSEVLAKRVLKAAANSIVIGTQADAGKTARIKGKS